MRDRVSFPSFVQIDVGKAVITVWTFMVLIYAFILKPYCFLAAKNTLVNFMYYANEYKIRNLLLFLIRVAVINDFTKIKYYKTK